MDRGAGTVKECCSYIYRFILMMCCCLSLGLFFPTEGYSVNFSINPVRIFLGENNATDVLKIKNQSHEDISLQIRSYEWTHDSKGENIYSPTKDIIFFPKMLTIQKDEEKIIRIGTNIPQGQQERTYRLFMEELPSPDPLETTGVRMLMKIGAPVFILPVQSELQGRIVSMEVTGGNVHIQVENRGNVHFIVNSIVIEGKDASGQEIYKTELGGWYIHGGHVKEYVITIPEEYCHSIHTLKADISTDKKLSFSEKLNVAKEMCIP